MYFEGDIVFAISDSLQMNVDLGKNILPTKVIYKGDTIVLGKKASKYKWMHKETFNDEKEYLTKLDNLLIRLCERAEYINKLVKEYEEVNITIYIRSDFAQIGYSLPSYIIKKIMLLDCDIYFDILSSGGVKDDED